MPTLTPRENYLRAVRRQEPVWVPFYLGFTPGALAKFREATGREDYAEFFRFPWRWISPTGRDDEARPGEEAYEPYYAGVDRPAGSRIDGFGVLRVPGSMYHFVKMVHPLRNAASVAEVEAYPWPPLPPEYTEAEIAAMRSRTDAVKAEGRAVLGPAGAIFEHAWSLRGLDNMLADLAVGNEVSDAILDWFTERSRRCAVACARIGCDTIDAGDDVGMQDRMMMAPDLWRRAIKPRASRVFAAAREVKPDLHITYHSDGYIEPIIPDLIEIGVDIINPVQPECMDQARIKRLYGDRLCLERCIGTQTVLPFGSGEEIDAQVKWTIDVLGAGGGLILGPTHSIEPDVPWKNIVAFYRAVLKHGGYDRYPGEMPVLS